MMAHVTANLDHAETTEPSFPGSVVRELTPRRLHIHEGLSIVSFALSAGSVFTLGVACGGGLLWLRLHESRDLATFPKGFEVLGLLAIIMLVASCVVDAGKVRIIRPYRAVTYFVVPPPVRHDNPRDRSGS